MHIEGMTSKEARNWIVYGVTLYTIWQVTRYLQIERVTRSVVSQLIFMNEVGPVAGWPYPLGPVRFVADGEGIIETNSGNDMPESADVKESY